MEKIKRFFKEEEGLELSEYALMGAIICVLVVGAVTALKNEIVIVFGKMVTAMQ